MNINLSYRINDEKIWHKIGDNLVPKKYWDTLKGRVGMRAVYVEGQRDDNLKGYVRIGLLPTKNEEYVGVNFDVNNHVDLEDCNAKDILFENWDKIIDFSKNVCKETLMKAMEQ
jgi:hypothetical protein